MVYSNRSTIFLKPVDASNKIKNHNYIYEVLKKVIEDASRENVVQVLTDNGSIFKKDGRKLMKQFNIIGHRAPHTVLF